MTSKRIATTRSKQHADHRRTNVNQATSASIKSTDRTSRPASTSEVAVSARTTKNSVILKLLKRPEGATIADIMQVTKWQQHSVRGFLAGHVKKKLGIVLTSAKANGDARRYRIVTHTGR